MLLAAPAWADADAGVEVADTADAGKQYEWATLPVIDGSTDIGIELGAFGVLTKLAPEGSGIPYEWSLSLILAAAAKNKPGGGLELPVHDDLVEFDWRSLNGRWRVVSDVWFWQSAVAGFYGLGNQSLATGDPRATSLRTVQYVRSELVAMSAVTWQLVGRLRLRAALAGRRVAPVIYPGSTLELAAAEEPLLLGLTTHGSLIGTLGLEYDTRDNEIAPNRGVYLSASVRGSPGPLTGNNLTFGGVDVHARAFYDVWPGRVVLSARVLFDGSFGAVPLHELARSGGFDAVWMLGGSDGVLGLPEGRYQGRLRLSANLEARVNVVTLTLFDVKFGLGLVAFVNGGRVWTDWVPRPDLDGTGLGMHMAYGGGGRLRIGETIILRFDVAYSPPPVTTADNPLGLYVDLGHIF